MADEHLRQGMIVWVFPRDARGKSKRRPVVIVTSDKEIDAGGEIAGVAVTTTFPQPPPRDHVELPWDPTGRAGTGLRRRSAAVCSWLVAFDPQDVDGVIGEVPAAALLRILNSILK